MVATVLRTGLEDTRRCLEEATAREKEMCTENKKVKESYYKIQMRAQATEREKIACLSKVVRS